MPDSEHFADFQSRLTPENEDEVTNFLTPAEPSELRALSNEELFRLVMKMSFANHWPYDARVQFEASSRQIAAINSLLQQTDELLRVTETSNRASKRTARISLWIAGIALALSFVFGASDYFGDKDWQNDQTRLLTEIRDRLPTP